MKFISTLLIFLMSALFIACGNEAANTTNTTNTTNVANTTENTKPAEEKKPEIDTSSLATPGDSIEYQIELVKKGDFETLKNCCFTDRVKNDLTKEMVDQAKEDAGKYTMEDLYDRVEEGEEGGKKTAKIIMKDGKTLTTLVETDGKWLADTIWFK